MNETTSPETQHPGRHRDHTASTQSDVADAVDHRFERRAQLRDRHAQGLTRLMEQRTDLRGVHALADFVDDAIRWSA